MKVTQHPTLLTPGMTTLLDSLDTADALTLTRAIMAYLGGDANPPLPAYLSHAWLLARDLIDRYVAEMGVVARRRKRRTPDVGPRHAAAATPETHATHAPQEPHAPLNPQTVQEQIEAYFQERDALARVHKFIKQHSFMLKDPAWNWRHFADAWLGRNAAS